MMSQLRLRAFNLLYGLVWMICPEPHRGEMQQVIAFGEEEGTKQFLDLRETVWDLLSNAVSNGHSFEGWSDMDIARDLLYHNANLCYFQPHELVIHVRFWLREGGEDAIE